MSDQDFLIDHALENVWCEPTQDFQYTITPSRYTRVVSGVPSRVSINQFNIELPKLGSPTYFHVYQIGAIPDASFDINKITSRWSTVLDVANAGDHVIDIFLMNGNRIPLSYCWLRRLYDGNIVLAVQVDRDIKLGTSTDYANGSVTVPASIGNSTLSVRFYRSGRAKQPSWRGTASLPDDPVTYYESKILGNVAFTAFMARCNDRTAEYLGQGVARYYLDGELINKPSGYSASIYSGRVLSFYYDSLVTSVVSRPLSSLGNFISTLDANVSKYFFLMDAQYGGIDYHDDLDFYLTSGTGLNLRGYYIGRHRKDTVRQVTHNSYAIRADSILSLIASNTKLTNHEAINIVCYVREGGRKTGLVHQNNRIEDLYLLPYEGIHGAMVGINSTVSEWKAANLENSSYSRIMRSKLKEITLDMVSSAYGYFALAEIAFSPVTKVSDINPFLLKKGYRIPSPALGQNLSIFTYDDGGVLVDNESISVNQSTLMATPSTNGVGYKHELINLPTDEEDDGTYVDQDVASKDLTRYGFRAYVCGLINGVPTEDWTDVTGGPYYSLDLTGVVPELSWNYGLLSIANLYPAVKIANAVMFYTQALQTANYPGIIRFSIRSRVDWSGASSIRVQRIPSDTLDVIMDGLTLIEGVDYYVKWPQVVVVKRPLTDPEDTLIQVRTIGYSRNNPLSHRTPREVGFARGGILSMNGRYDPRNDRNIKIVSAGRVMARDEVSFAENSVTGGLVPDGSPYMIDDQRLTIEGVVNKSTLEMVIASEEIDARVSNYLTGKLPEVTVPVGFVELGRWEVVSPLASAVLHLMAGGVFLSNGELDQSYDTEQMDIWLDDYLYLLDYEPSRNGADLFFVNIRPHQYDTPMVINVQQYLFLEKICSHYLGGAIDLTSYINIGA